MYRACSAHSACVVRVVRSVAVPYDVYYLYCHIYYKMYVHLENFRTCTLVRARQKVAQQKRNAYTA